MKLVNGRQLARVLRTSYASVMRWAVRGEIPSLKVGRLRRFDVEDVVNAVSHSHSHASKQKERTR